MVVPSFLDPRWRKAGNPKKFRSFRFGFHTKLVSFTTCLMAHLPRVCVGGVALTQPQPPAQHPYIGQRQHFPATVSTNIVHDSGSSSSVASCLPVTFQGTADFCLQQSLPPRKRVHDPYNHSGYRVIPNVNEEGYFHRQFLEGRLDWVSINYKHASPLQRPPLGVKGSAPSYFVAGLPNNFVPSAIASLFEHIERTSIVADAWWSPSIVRMYSDGMHRNPNGQKRTTCHIFVTACGAAVYDGHLAKVLNERVLWDVGGAWVATTPRQANILHAYLQDTTVFSPDFGARLYRAGCPNHAMRVDLAPCGPPRAKRGARPPSSDTKARRGGKSYQPVAVAASSSGSGGNTSSCDEGVASEEGVD